MHSLLIIDLGTSWIKIVLLDETLQVARETRFVTPFEYYEGIPVIDPRAVVDDISQAVESFAVEALAADACAISVTGMGSTILDFRASGILVGSRMRLTPACTLKST